MRCSGDSTRFRICASRAAAASLPLAAAVLVAGCSTAHEKSAGSTAGRLPALASARTVGRGARFRPGATGRLAARAEPVAGMRCASPRRPLAAAHVEIFAAGHVVQIPAGIGFAPPLRRRGAYVMGGRCAYPLRTSEPTGLLLMEQTRGLTLGRLFALWGQPLAPRVVAGFPARGGGVSVFIDGSRWAGEPAAAPIAPWTQIAIEVGPLIAPHRSYTFPPLSSLALAR